MNHKHIIKSLPMLASILGRKYGVQVRIGGDTACTNGKIIQLPDLPMDNDSTLLNLVRAYVDHESAHIRDTNFKAVKQAKLSNLEQYIWNMIEDWRVENKLASVYSGCRENFQWLIKHLFLPKSAKRPRKKNIDPAKVLLEWMLINIRAWDVQELDPECLRLKIIIEQYFPKLVADIELILNDLRKYCPDTETVIIASKTICKLIAQEINNLEQQVPKLQQPSMDQHGNQSAEVQQNTLTSRGLQSLQKMCSGSPDQIYGDNFNDVGAQIKKMLSKICKNDDGSITVAVPMNRKIESLSEEDVNISRSATTALRVKLQALLQGQCIIRNRSSYTGRLNTHKLHTLATGNAKIFKQLGERVGLNTVIHIVLDKSGSMSGKTMQLASQACFALASALNGLQGIKLAVTAFPGALLENSTTRSWQTVVPILNYGEKLHSNFTVNACGSTPMDAALWWVMQEMLPLTESRKIVLILTDGKPDSENLAVQAISAARGFGIELYGIGIATDSIAELLPNSHSRVINDIAELAPAMFSMLQKALLQN